MQAVSGVVGTAASHVLWAGNAGLEAAGKGLEAAGKGLDAVAAGSNAYNVGSWYNGKRREKAQLHTN